MKKGEIIIVMVMACFVLGTRTSLAKTNYRCKAHCLVLTEGAYPEIPEPQVTGIFKIKGDSYESLKADCYSTEGGGRSMLVAKYKTYSEIIGLVRPEYRFLKSYKKSTKNNSCSKLSVKASNQGERTLSFL